MAKIGIFGGSFNPPHLGHTLALKEFREKLGLDRVLVIPAAVPPHKRLSPCAATAGQRLQMARLAFENLPCVTVSDLELRREGPSYTADTVAALRAQFPKDELFLLMGTDMFLSFDRWYAPEAIAREVTLVAAHRSAESPLSAQAQKLRARGARAVLLENDCLPYSSTSVRALLAFGAAERYLAPQVLTFIRENGLYFTNRSLKNLPYESLEAVSLALHKPSRVAHAKGTAETAEELARLYGVDAQKARRAGILHDITKALTPQEQLELCENFSMLLSAFERSYPKILHARTGAEVARRVFGECEEVCEAILWHTTGRAGMTTLEKIIYLADYTEPNRTTEGVQALRELCRTDLDAALRMGLEAVVRYLTAQGAAINEHTFSALAAPEREGQHGTI